MNNNIKHNVEPREKKEFLEWILRNEHFLNREVVWILNYIKGASLIKDISFVDTLEDNGEPLLFITTKSGAEGLVSFGLQLDVKMETDHEKVFHYIRTSNNKIKIYIDFENKYQNDKFLKVLESYDVGQELSLQVQEEADTIIRKMEKENVLKMIDKALDQRDEEMFMELWRMYLGMEKK